MNQPRKSGRFIKKSVLHKLKRGAETLKLVNARKIEAKRGKLNSSSVSTCKVNGNRFVDIGYLAESMKCDSCDTRLSFEFVEKEEKRGLASIFTIRCHNCLLEKKVSTTRKVGTKEGYSLHKINCAAAIDCTNSGVGYTQLRKLLTAMDIPPPSYEVLKLAERRVAIQEEKEHTL